MKFTIKFIALILVLLFTFAAAGCEEKTVNGEGTLTNESSDASMSESESDKQSESDNEAETEADKEVLLTFETAYSSWTMPDAISGHAGDVITLPEFENTLEGAFFGGWSDGFRYYYPGDEYILKEDAVMTARAIEKTSTVLLDNCDSTSGWWGSDVYAENGRIYATMNKDNCIIFCRGWTESPIDLSALNNPEGEFKISVYIDDVDAISGQVGRLELSHDLGYAHTSWALEATEWKQGENILRLKLADAITENCDLTKVNYMRLYQYAVADSGATASVDNLEFVSSNGSNIIYESGFVGDEAYISTSQFITSAGSEITVIQNPFDKLHYKFAGWRDNYGNTTRNGAKYTVSGDTIFTACWIEDEKFALEFNLDGGKGSADTIEQYAGYLSYLPEAPKKDGFVFASWNDGEKSYSANSPYIISDKNVTFTAEYKPMLAGFTDGLVEAWSFADGAIGTAVISDIGATDGEQRWATRLASKTFGYTLDFSTEGSYFTADSENINLANDFTLAAWIKAPKREVSDRTILSFGELAVDGEAKYTDFTPIDSVDDDDWMGGRQRKKGQKEGDGYYAVHTNGSTEKSGGIVISKFFSRKDFSDYMDGGYIHMWVYAENAANITGGDLEFTSSGGCDKEEMAWSVSSLELKDGWNEVYLPIDKAVLTGEFNPESFNYCRFYFFTSDTATIGIDDISLCRKVEDDRSGAVKLYLDAANSYQLTVQMAGVSGIEPSGVSLDDGAWHHVAVSLAGDKFTYYIDGEAVKTCTVSGKSSAAAGTLMIAADMEGKNGLDGSATEIRIYNKAVTPDKITDTVIDEYDNQRHDTRMSLKNGIVFDRRQYMAPRPLPMEYQTVTENDIINVKNMGFDHVKLLLTPNHLIDEEGGLKIENMEYITELVDYAVKHEMPAYICLHPENDFKQVYLGNTDNFELLCRFYGELAAYIGSHWSADECGLQLMTEPHSQNTNYSWTWYSDRMWSAVRNVLPEHTILTSSDAAGNIERLKLMSPATDDNLIYTFTSYEPYSIGWHWYGSYTENGGRSYWRFIKDVPYPVEEGVDYTDAIEDAIELVPEQYKASARRDLTAYVKGINDGGSTYVNNYDSLYNREWHFLRAKSLDDWSEANGGDIHLMIVEWGCMDNTVPRVLWAPDMPEEAGTTDELRYLYLRDMRESFEEYDIGWSYWSYNSAHTVFTGEGYVAMRTYYRENCLETGDVPDSNGRCYGISPDPETAIGYFDFELLEYALGLTPLVENPNK